MSEEIKDNSISLAPPHRSFLSLPDELIQAVFDAAPKCKVPLLSKRLLPFYRSQIDYNSIYSSIKINSLKQFGKLARTISWNSSLGALVRTLEIDGVKKGRQTDSDGPTPQQLSHFFDSLPNLTVLVIVNHGEGCQAFLKSNSANCAPNLEALHLQGALKGQVDPFSTPHLIGIANRMKIKKLELLLETETRSCASSPPSFLRLAYPSLESIALSGPLSASDSAKTLFDRSKPSVVVLFDRSKPSVVVLSDSSPHPSLWKLLSGFSFAESVNNLSLSCRVHTSDPQEYRKELIRFTNLTSLELSHGAMSGAGTPFYNSLRQLTQLETLTFGRGCDVSVTELRHLVTPGKKKHSSLKSIVLNNVFAKRGSYVESKSQHDWTFPQWTKKFTEKGLGELMKAAREGGVELDGSSLNAGDIKSKFSEALWKAKDRAKEIAWVVRKRGCHWDEAEEILERRDRRNRQEDYYGYDRYVSDEEDEDEEEEDDVAASTVWLT
ncbi:hypothetical protein JCM3765_003155 [Sporobolomyces pararoseus]